MIHETENDALFAGALVISRTKRWLLLMSAVMLSLSAGISAAEAQDNTIVLPPITMNVDNSAYAKTKATGQSDIRNIASSDPSIAWAREWGTNSVQINAKRPGVTTISFRDDATGTTYRVTVTVTRPNPPPVKKPNTPNNPGSGGNNNNTGGNSNAGDVKPVDIADKGPFGKPTKQNLTNGGYKEIFKNEAGQIVEEREYDNGGKLTTTKYVNKLYPNGKEAESYTRNAKGEIKEFYSDPSGKIIRTETYKDLNADGQATTKEVTENGETKVYKRDPVSKEWKLKKEEPKKPADNKDPNRPKNERASGPIDRCLIGTWRSESVVRLAKSGGAGIMMTVKSDGEVTIDYTGMQEVKQVIVGRVVAADSWSGSATGHIATDNGSVSVSSVEKSELSGKETNTYGTRPISASGLGPVFSGVGKPFQLTYTCDNTTLIIKAALQGQTRDTYTFKREKKEP